MAEYNEKKRNALGIIGWFVVSLVINLLALVPMVLRERYQWEKYNLPEIEWYDILRYGVAIVIGSGLQGLTLQYFFEM
jgi:hypothetical protein